MKTQITKMHGAQNDFVVLDRRNADAFDAAAFARWACNRREGVGADGCILLEKARTADVRMRTVNADGTEAEMCGNGIRCAARWLDEAGEGDRIAFETHAGIVRTEVVARNPDYLVRVAMGRPNVRETPLPMVPDAAFVEIGNPHVVIFRSGINHVDLEAVAEALQHEPLFPFGTNVHVVEIAGQRMLRVRHWERGVGLTMACGTGAVACAAVALERGAVATPVEVFVPGGRLVIEWNGIGDAHLVGPAVRVFDTEVSGGAGALP